MHERERTLYHYTTLFPSGRSHIRWGVLCLHPKQNQYVAKIVLLSCQCEHALRPDAMAERARVDHSDYVTQNLWILLFILFSHSHLQATFGQYHFNVGSLLSPSPEHCGHHMCIGP